jgi:hypothetical protein
MLDINMAAITPHKLSYIEGMHTKFCSNNMTHNVIMYTSYTFTDQMNLFCPQSVTGRPWNEVPWTPIHISLQLLHFPLQHTPPHPTSSHLAILFTLMLVVTSFTTDKCFGEVDIGQRTLEGNITAGMQAGGSLKCSHPYHPWDFLLQPQCSVSFLIGRCMIYSWSRNIASGSMEFHILLLLKCTHIVILFVRTLQDYMFFITWGFSHRVPTTLFERLHEVLILKHLFFMGPGIVHQEPHPHISADQKRMQISNCSDQQTSSSIWF